MKNAADMLSALERDRWNLRRIEGALEGCDPCEPFCDYEVAKALIEAVREGKQAVLGIAKVSSMTSEVQARLWPALDLFTDGEAGRE